MTTPFNDLEADLAERPLTVPSASLEALLWREPGRCATVSEYAQNTGLPTERVLDEFGPYLEDGSLDLEVVGGEMFVHSAPQGRPSPASQASAPANLWERLRDRGEPPLAYTFWRLIRQMERAGWGVETAPGMVTSGLGPLADPPFIGVYVRHAIVPILAFPTPATINEPAGLLSDLEHAGAAAIGIACDNGALSEMVTAARSWMMSKQLVAEMSVMILESPRFSPTILRPVDSSITPVSVTHAVVDDLTKGP